MFCWASVFFVYPTLVILDELLSAQCCGSAWTWCGSGSGCGYELISRKYKNFTNFFFLIKILSLRKNDLLCFVLSNYLYAWNKSVILCSKIRYYGDFCRFLCEFPMILTDILLPPGSGRPKWCGSDRIRIHITAFMNLYDLNYADYLLPGYDPGGRNKTDPSGSATLISTMSESYYTLCINNFSI